jgi:hypothetical protein
LLAAIALTSATSSSLAAAPLPNAIVGDTSVQPGTTPLPNAIVGDTSVQPGTTWANPDTHQTYRLYTVTVRFTHRGPIWVQVDEHAAPNPGERLTYDNGSVSRTGTDTVSFTLGYGLVGQPVYFEAWLYQPATYGGKPPGALKHPEVIYDSQPSGTYTN